MEYLIDPFNNDLNEIPDGSDPAKARPARPPGSAVALPPIYFPLYGVNLPSDDVAEAD